VCLSRNILSSQAPGRQSDVVESEWLRKSSPHWPVPACVPNGASGARRACSDFIGSENPESGNVTLGSRLRVKWGPVA
jgi:hypothetical protein